VGTWEDPALAEREKRPRRRFYRLTSEGRTATAEAQLRAAELTGTSEAGARGRA
jgi:DNA-binding PadR family transcriptional regulator